MLMWKVSFPGLKYLQDKRLWQVFDSKVMVFLKGGVKISKKDMTQEAAP